MRIKALLMLGVVAAMGGGCGDDSNVTPTPDAPRGPQCSDGIDNDGDGLVDYPDDPGCAAPSSDDEDGPIKPQCSDGRDNDGDGLVDYPMDPGCFAPAADSEVDDCPTGPSCPQCANGIDDDGNGSMDYPDDVGCTAASDPFEFTENPVACGETLTIKNLPPTGMDQGMLDTTSTSELVPSCGGVTGAPAIAYLVNLPEPKVLVATTMGSAPDTVLMLRGANCSGTQSELACNDDISASNKASSITASLAAGSYYLIVSGATANAVGEFSLKVETFVGEGETCGVTEDCGPGLVCRTPVGETEMQCAQPVCNDGRDDDGDGLVDYPFDPGCETPDDDDESDDCPDGPSCPACGNGIDDDDDGFIDYPDDPNCASASGTLETCPSSEPVLEIVAGVTSGTTSGATNDYRPPPGTHNGVLCSNSSSHSAPDLVYSMQLPATRELKMTLTPSGWDATLVLLDSTCSDAFIACSDPATMAPQTNLAAGYYHVVVDGYTGASGPFDLTVSGTIENGGSCEVPLAQAGALQCALGYTCKGMVGSRTCQPVDCADGIDNDGDGKTDYPNDPGCVSALDNDETDDCPDGPSCPECSDGVDNDNDGHIDYPDDQSCQSAGGTSESCASTEDVIEIVGPVTSGTTVGAANDVQPSCGSSSNHTAPDRTYKLEIPSVTALEIGVTNKSPSSWDSTLVLLDSTCAGTQLACSDPNTMTAGARPAGTYFVVVDGYSTASGSYDLNVSGTIADGESCESPLAQSGALTCGVGYACQGAAGSRTCQPVACNDSMDNDGDGKVDFPNDPGCESIADDDESDDCPDGASCPACGDGIDNDGDGHIDYPADATCISASGTSEACRTSEDLVELVAPVTAGTTVGAINDVRLTCGAAASSHTAPDRAYMLQLPNVSALTISLSNHTPSGWNSTMALFDSTCGPNELVCSDPNTLTSGARPAGTYYLAVDGYSSASGSYNINVSGTIANGGSCEVPLAQSGALTCAANYTCKGPDGARTCQRTQCSDGLDNDGDGIADFPNEPGCSSPQDDDETDDCPSGPNCPECSDQVDNDGDSFTDYPDDPSCAAAGGTSEACQSTEPVMALVSPTTSGTTVGATNDVSPACGATTNTAPDHTYRLDLPGILDLRINVTKPSSWDSIIAVYDATCEGTALACRDPDNLTVGPRPAGTYYFVIDGYSSASGAYTIDVSGTIAPGESCEAPLALSGALTCSEGFTCAGAPGARTCQAAACADGIDNDGDGLIDFPNDPGCETYSDPDEEDPATAPVCSNGQDDDGDMLTDYPADYGCSGAGGASEVFCAPELDPTTRITAPQVMGTTSGKGSHFASTTCGSSSGGDEVYALVLPQPVETLDVRLSGTWDQVLSVRDVTCGAELACADATTSSGERVTLQNVVPGSYAIVVDGYNNNSGSYTLEVKGTVADGSSCEGDLFASGVLACSASSTCDGPMGARTCRPAQCGDGIDNDGDGEIDYPLDPGCVDRGDDDETDPSVLPECANGVDDDADGQTDYPADTGCFSASHPVEAACDIETDPVAMISTPVTTGTTTGATNDFTSASCRTTSSGEDHVRGLWLPVPVESLRVSLSGSGVDWILAVREAMCGADLGCQDTGLSGTAETVTLADLAAGVYWIIVDAWGGGDGAYTLNVTGTVAAGTACDSALFASGVLSCPSGTTCSSTTQVCE